MNKPTDPESVVREIKRKTRRKFSSEEKIRIVLEGLRGEERASPSCVAEKASAPTSTTTGAKSFWRLARGGSKGTPNARPPAARSLSFVGRTGSLSRWWRSYSWRSAS
jgi:transposase-like protein